MVHLLGDVDDRTADAALAERRRRELQDHRAVRGKRVGEVDVVHVVGRHPRVDLLELAADVLLGRRVDDDRCVAVRGTFELRATFTCAGEVAISWPPSRVTAVTR